MKVLTGESYININESVRWIKENEPCCTLLLLVQKEEFTIRLNHFDN